jgi:hypothetical protein
MAYQAKTKPTETTVGDFLAALPDPRRREEGQAIADLMAEVTGEPAVQCGPSIIGFGRYAYTYDSGHSGEMCRIGFSPRKAQLVFYLGSELPGRDSILARLGKHKTGKGCLYLNRLSDADPAVLRELVAASWAWRDAKR